MDEDTEDLLRRVAAHAMGLRAALNDLPDLLWQTLAQDNAVELPRLTRDCIVLADQALRRLPARKAGRQRPNALW